MWPPTDESIKTLLGAYKPQSSKRKADEETEDVSPAKKMATMEGDRLSQSMGLPSKSKPEEKLQGSESEESLRLSQSDGFTQSLKRKSSEGSYSDSSPQKIRRDSSVSESGETTPGWGSKDFGQNKSFDYSPQKRQRNSSVSSFSSTGSSDVYDPSRKLSTSEDTDYSPTIPNRDSKSERKISESGPKWGQVKDPAKSPKGKDMTTTPRRKGAEIPPPSPNKWSQIRDSPQKHRMPADGPGSRDPQNYFKKRPGLGFQAKSTEEATTPKKAPSVDPFAFEEDEDSAPAVTKSESQTRQSRTSQRNNSGNSRRELRPRSSKR